MRTPTIALIAVLAFSCMTTNDAGDEVVDYEKTALIVEVAADELDDEARLREEESPGSGDDMRAVAGYVRTAAEAVRAYGAGGSGPTPEAVLEALIDFAAPYLESDDESVREAARMVRSAARLAIVSLS